MPPPPATPAMKSRSGAFETTTAKSSQDTVSRKSRGCVSRPIARPVSVCPIGEANLTCLSISRDQFAGRLVPGRFRHRTAYGQSYSPSPAPAMPRAAEFARVARFQAKIGKVRGSGKAALSVRRERRAALGFFVRLVSHRPPVPPCNKRRPAC